MPVLKKAQDAGVVIVNIDNRLDLDACQKAGLKNVPFISVKNADASYQSAKTIADLAKGPAKAVLIEGIRDADNAKQRLEGAVKAFAENKNIQVVASESANWKIDEAHALAQKLFEANPDISLVFCANDMMALGVVQYLKENNLQKVLVAGFDNLDDMKTAIRDKWAYVTIDQQADVQGYTGVVTAVKLLGGTPVDSNVYVDFKVVTAGIPGQMKKLFTNSLLKRILIYQIIIGIVPLLFIGLSSIFMMSRTLEKNAVQFQEETVRQGTLYIDLVMDDVESLIANLSGIDEVNRALSNSSGETPYEKLVTQAKIGYILSGYTSLKGLISIDLFSGQNEHYHVGETLNAANINEDILQKLYTETKNTGDFVNWSGIDANINMDSEYQSVVTASKLLNAKSDGSGSSEGLLVVSYDPAVFNKVFGEASDPSSYSIVLDRQNRIVYHPSSPLIGHTLADELSRQITGQHSSNSFRNVIDGKQMLIVFDGTQKGGWTLARFIPLQSLLSQANYMTLIFVFILVLMLSITALFGFSMSRQLVKPIRTVTDTFRQLQSGNFREVPKLKLVHQDEIGELGNLFNSFIDAREDITTQKKLERQLNEQNQDLQRALTTLRTTQAHLVQQEKMAGIGQLAAGVAHEINNPLGFVTSNFSVLKDYLAKLETLFAAFDTLRQDESFRASGFSDSLEKAWRAGTVDFMRGDLPDLIGDTQDGLKRIAAIVNALKTFSRSSMLEEKSPYDLNEGIRTTLIIANNEIKYTSTVDFRPGQLPMVQAIGGQINQVLLNIIINATQAIKQKQTKDGLISIGTFVDSGYICCEIGDNGCGMTDDVAKRIFEPFYTTKPIGQGTGLGLSLAYDIIVHKHQGKIEVSSQHGVGTLFRILLPVSAQNQEDVHP